jgi:hypothetical protein
MERIAKVAADVGNGVFKADEKMLLTLKKHLVGVFLSATLYSVDATLNFLKHNNALGAILTECFAL